MKNNLANSKAIDAYKNNQLISNMTLSLISRSRTEFQYFFVSSSLNQF